MLPPLMIPDVAPFRSMKKTKQCFVSPSPLTRYYIHLHGVGFAFTIVTNHLKLKQMCV
jgi:hypothetical protein